MSSNESKERYFIVERLLVGFTSTLWQGREATKNLSSLVVLETQTGILGDFVHLRG